MKVLFIGGTGLLSSACSQLASARGMEVFILNRAASNKYPIPEGATLIQGDVRMDRAELTRTLNAHHFDQVVDFIAFDLGDIERDLELFGGRIGQFVFISSASAYQKPPRHYLITEETPLENPLWQYSRDKIACEARLMEAYRTDHFPLTIIRPSLTYGPSQIPIAGASWQHPWTIVDRIRRGQKVIVPGDGNSLWVLTWNDDFAKGLVGLLGNDRALGEAFQITSDEVLTWDQIFLELYRALGESPNLIHIPSDLIVAYHPEQRGTLTGDKMNSAVFDNSKIKRFVPEFRCEVNWAEGVRRSIGWFEEAASRRTVDADMNVMWDRIIAGYEKAFPQPLF